MKKVHIVLDGKSEFYSYRCAECGREFASWPVYYPGSRQCKYCPDCGHEFKDPSLSEPEMIEKKSERETRRSSVLPVGGAGRHYG